MKPLHMALVLLGPTLDLAAGAYNYNTWNGEALVDDWSDTYWLELTSGLIELSLASVHLFVMPKVGKFLGPVQVVNSLFELYKVNDSESNAPASGQSTNFAYFAHIANLALGGYNIYHEMTKKKHNGPGPDDHQGPPPSGD